ncbi:hypothetical protein LOZ12_003104 [Ophidiomyces ophidiicola]|uniref:Uncharacterized protein n=1 Tax=Ophidiomyces ophidiicola TaxID=1387563 RepID=A0ACB8V0H3_9EURO|nr:uncharacterized protein LOZ57_001270 [Ophidiomyces ophidiicola]KAI1911355.1 hypothetical protein LOZ61_003878 [Ophidiomyces ophidiicola]KAI1918499.1 hypothetical protein LOZ64_002728 [Ophidiomyces ophidiicola]KAI1926858.1 hypothetical protein LOZ60_003347 [Ophidiomyces ophidiicola]KAI1947338.1 hypothetical protein LOZ62_003026 [Ophidiomyces ophidiicola]KAI1951857.1 hypothetical protein LOZ57_001270 [Ophidiomyces ophidiicola]
MHSPIPRSIPGLWPLFSLVLLNISCCIATVSDGPHQEEVITADVCVIGGGSTGTYAGVKLKDEGKSVVIIEQEDHLGGHVGTFYVDDKPIDYGVQGFFNTDITLKYLDRLKVSHEPLQPATTDNRYVNFRTGKLVQNESSPMELGASLLLYFAVVSKFKGIADGSYNLPDPVPEELLMPFGEFSKKYKLNGALPVVWMFAHGCGDILDATTLCVLQLFGKSHVAALLKGYVRAKRGTAEVYKKAAEILGQDVLYESKVSKVTRSNSGVTVVVRTKGEKIKEIRAKKLLVTIVPTLGNMEGFDLDEKEKFLFKQWSWKNYYIGIVKKSGLPENSTIVNLDPTKPAQLPHIPFVWRLDYLGVSGYHTIKIVGDSKLTESDAKELVLGGIRRMGSEGTFSIQKPEIAVWGSHVPLTLGVSTEAVKGGFYRDLYALQGHKNTFYTGLSFCSDYSTLLWDFTNTIVGKMGL